MSNRKSQYTLRKRTILKKNKHVDNFIDDFIKHDLILSKGNNDTINNRRGLLFDIPIVSQTADRQYTLSINCLESKPSIYCNCVSYFNPNVKRIANCKHVKLFLCQLFVSTKNNLAESDDDEKSLAELLQSVSF